MTMLLLWSLWSLCVVVVVHGAISLKQFHETTTSVGHTVRVSPPMAFTQWAIFPEQEELHARVVSSDKEEVMRTMDKSKIVDLKTFWDHDSHKTLLGIIPSTEMKLKHIRPAKHGLTSASHVTFDQVVDEVRVYGGEFRVTVGEHGGVVNAHGLPFRQTSKADYVISRAEKIMTTTIDDSLQSTLYQSIENHIRISQGDDAQVIGVLPRVDITGVSNKPVELVWYSTSSVEGKNVDGTWSLTYHMSGVKVSVVGAKGTHISSQGGAPPPLEVSKESGEGTSKMVLDVFIDAETLTVVGLFDKTSRYSSPFTNPLGRDVEVTHSPSDAIVFDNTNTFPTNDAEIDLLVTNTMYASNIMHSISGGEYETWAKQDTKLNIEYQLAIANAYFDGQGIAFGSGFVTDDIVGHEWGHGYMETATQSLYQYQPGAMDEAFADILGESIDILNMDTADTVGMRSSVYPPTCTTEMSGPDDTNRWSIGEELTGTITGSVRDMYAPTCHYHGDSTYSPYYYCGHSDYGGVHWNSGVVNRLYSVLVDGGVYDEIPGSSTGVVSISAIGMTTALNLFWDAYQELTPTGQFLDLAYALRQSCNLLVGADLYEPNLLSTSYSISSLIITSEDCIEVSCDSKLSSIENVIDIGSSHVLCIQSGRQSDYTVRNGRARFVPIH